MTSIRVFGFLTGAVVAGASVYYYVLGDYRVANEMLTDDILVCFLACFLFIWELLDADVYSIGTAEGYHQAAVVHHRAGDEDEPATEEIGISFTLSSFILVLICHEEVLGVFSSKPI